MGFIKDICRRLVLRGPKPTSESMLRVLNLDGDARRVHGGLS
jgi:hypothetical protein